MYSVIERVIYETGSVCPVCLKKIRARVVSIGTDIYQKKICPKHGEFRTIIWRGLPGYIGWNRENKCTPPEKELRKKKKGCPFDCGLCTEHKEQACCVLLEVAKGCNQNCDYCFASSADSENEPFFSEIVEWMEYLMKIGGKRPFNIQLSGGEPTIRDDLADIIRAGKKLGFPYIQLNTNGLRLAEDENYVKQLKEAGLSSVFLQFDGTDDEIYEKLRGRKLIDIKKKALENCARHEIGTVLVPTLVPGVNTDNIGEIIRFALKRLPYVRGVHFQPVSYFGRYPLQPSDSDRITLPEVIRAIEIQTEGKIKAAGFGPRHSGSALCSFRGSFLLRDDGEIEQIAEEGGCCCSCGNDKPPIIKDRDFVLNRWEMKQDGPSEACTEDYDFREWDEYIDRIRNYGFSITGMAFQDAWNLDLGRLKKCSVHIFDGARKELIPFCAYNLTNARGRALYRR